MEWCCDDGINILWQKNTMYHMVQFTVNKLQLTYHTLMYRIVNYTATYSIRQFGSGSAATRSTYIMSTLTVMQQRFMRPGFRPRTYMYGIQSIRCGSCFPSSINFVPRHTVNYTHTYCTEHRN